MPNFANVDCGYLEITAESKPLIESGYEARKEGELPVLIEYVDRAKLPSLPKATFLDIILYSREQIIKENIAMGSEVSTLCHTTPLLTPPLTVLHDIYDSLQRLTLLGVLLV